MNIQRHLHTCIISLFLSVLGGFGIFAFGLDPSFSIIPDSFTGKLHCNYIMNMRIHPAGIAFNTFQNTISFDGTNVLLTHISIDPTFNYLTDVSFSGFLYKTWGAMIPGQSSTAIITGALRFGFRTTTNITGTELFITDKYGNPVVFDSESMSDGAVIQSYVTTKDILTGVNHGSYTRVPLPCIPDTNPPKMGGNYPLNNARYIPENATISMVLYDRVGAHNHSGPEPLGTNSTMHYRYAGNDTGILSNYVAVVSGVDNQEGVNSGTISITLDCPDCIAGSRPYTFTPTSPSLTITDWTGNSSINMLTWQNKIRGYALSLPAPSPYEIEKQVNVDISVTDNPNENNQTHTGYPAFSFNAPENPTITRIQPSTSTNIPLTFTPFVFDFKDDRAGIDTGTISITIPEYSSGTKFYTGHTYSGSELIITLIGGNYGTGYSGSYQVSFSPLRPFPSNTTLQITGFVKDLAGNIGTYNSSFTTAMSCLDRGCADIFTVDILGGLNIGTTLFTGFLIQVTGTALGSQYPYLTGLNNDILMCGRPYLGTILTGNIPITNTLGTSIKGTLYTADVLYITGLDGLDFIYDNGTIIIN